MNISVGFVLELLRPEPAVLLNEFTNLFDHPQGFPLFRGQDDLCAQEPHQLSALNAEAFRHDDHERVAFRGTDHGQADTRVATGCFDNGLSRLQRAVLFSLLDDVHRQAVFDRSTRICRFELDVHRYVIGRYSLDFYARGVPNQINDRVILVRHCVSLSGGEGG